MLVKNLETIEVDKEENTNKLMTEFKFQKLL